LDSPDKEEKKNIKVSDPLNCGWKFAVSLRQKVPAGYELPSAAFQLRL
jgi:hypothetical protein